MHLERAGGSRHPIGGGGGGAADVRQHAESSAPREHAQEVEVEHEMPAPEDTAHGMQGMQGIGYTQGGVGRVESTPQRTSAILLAWEICDTHTYLLAEISAICQSLQTRRPQGGGVGGSRGGSARSAHELEENVMDELMEDLTLSNVGFPPISLPCAPATVEREGLFGPISPPLNLVDDARESSRPSTNPFADSNSHKEDMTHVHFSFLHPRPEPLLMSRAQGNALPRCNMGIGCQLLQVFEQSGVIHTHARARAHTHTHTLTHTHAHAHLYI